MQMERNKLALLLSLDYIRNRIVSISTAIPNMNVMEDNISAAFDERKAAMDIARVLDIRLGYVWEGTEDDSPGVAREDATLIFNGFLKRLEGVV